MTDAAPQQDEQEKLTPALKCEGCNLSVRPKKLHKTFRDCQEALKYKVAEQRHLLDSSAEAMKQLRSASQLLWVLINTSAGKKISVTFRELDVLPAAAMVKMYPTSLGITAEIAESEKK